MKKLKPLDYVLIFICLCVAGFSVLFTLQTHGEGVKLIATSPQYEWVYDLDDDQALEFEGAIGVTHITIEDGHAFFVQSPCDNQTCILSHPIKDGGDWSACLPNQIFIRIEGEKNGENKSVKSTDETLDILGF